MTRCGAAAVDITPQIPIGMAGYSRAGKKATGASGSLFARSLFFEDDAGRRVGICYVDLMSGSRFLLNRTAELTAGLLTPGQLLLAGTHTHTGPGRFYGNKFYDHFAQSDSGFHEQIAEALAKGIAQSLVAAAANASPARVGFASVDLWGVSRNRSLTAFQENPISASWRTIHQPPAGLDPDLQAVDPRVRVMSVVRAGSPTLIGAFASFSCHATALGADHDKYDPDWPGLAATVAQQQLGAGAIVAVTIGAAADLSPTRRDVPQGPALAQLVGTRVGQAMADAARRAADAAQDIDVSSAFAEFEPARERDVDGRPDTRLSERWAIGAPTLAGGVDGRSDLFHLGLAKDGMIGQDFPFTEPSFPKTRALGQVQQILVRLLGLEQARTLPFQIVRIGRQLFVAIPGEPTVTFGHQVESALLEGVRADGVHVIGYAGDYAGYITTHEEYMIQNYEGSSMIYGRFFSRHLLARIQKLAKGM